MNYGRLNNGVVEYYKSKNGCLYTGDYYIYNPSEEQYIQAGWYPIQIVDEEGIDEIKDNVLYVHTSTEKKLRKAIDDKMSELYEYDESQNVNEFFLNGNSMWISLNERKNIRQSLDVLEDDEEWTYWYDGTPITMSVPKFKELLKAIERYAILCKNNTFKHEFIISNLNNLEDIYNYDITTGYPEKVEL